MPKNKDVKEEHYIVDSTGTNKVDYAYAKLGSKEGWLVYTQGNRDQRGIICHMYRHTG